MKQFFYISFLLVFASCNQLDEARFKWEIVKGNNALSNQNFEEAKKHFNQAKLMNENSFIPYFNIGNTNYLSLQTDSAYYEYEQANSFVKDSSYKTKIYHNYGDAYLQKYHLLNNDAQNKNDSTEKLKKEVLTKALNQFKLSLNEDYKNDSAQYNYIYTLNLLKQEENNQQQNKDKNEENKDENKDKNQPDKQDQNKDSKDKKDEQKQPSQTQNISKNQALQDLKALENKEKKLLQKLNLKKEEGTPVKTEKDW